MARFLTKFKIPTAVQRSYPKNFDCEHVTSCNFFTPMVAYNQVLFEGQRIKVDPFAIVQSSSLVVPTFTTMSLNFRCFFVPFRTVYPGFTDLRAQSPHVFSNGTSIPGQWPYCLNTDLCAYFVNPTYGCTSVVTDQASADFSYVDANSNVVFYQFTTKGKRIYNLFLQLGYKINWHPLDNGKVNLLPVYSYVRVYLDYYFPSAYTNDSVFTTLLQYLKYDNTNLYISPIDPFMELLDKILVVKYDDVLFC
jgi:hypothetical protein